MTVRSFDDAVAELVGIYGSDPQAVGAEDGTEDDFGDLVCDAVELLGYPFETLSDETWDHVQDVAAAAQATTMDGWLAIIDAAIKATE